MLESHASHQESTKLGIRKNLLKHFEQIQQYL